MMSSRPLAFVALLFVTLSAPLMAQTPMPAPAATGPQALAIVEEACAVGAFTASQCAFFKQWNDADRQVRQIVASGEFAKLPKASQDAMTALYDTAKAGLAVIKEYMDKAAPMQSKAPSNPDSFLERYSMKASNIREKCATDWPTDFTMRAHCEEQQKEAGQKLSQRAMTAGDRFTIRQQCLAQWANDLVMQNHCEEQQLEALQKLGR